MKKTLIVFSLATFLLFHIECSAQFNIGKIKLPTSGKNTSTSTGLSESDIIKGLKEALTVGSGNASKQLNKADGYFKNPLIKIPFPEEVAHVEKTLRNLGFGKKVDDFILALNRSAEDAAKESAPIFGNAIKQMTFADAKNILTGPDTAATGYLRKTTYSSLYNTFSPHINTALGKNYAASKWTELATIYNKLPTTRNKIETDLVRYTTHKALKGLFIVVAQEETKIRKDPVARTSEILKKVFGSK